jgi:hypothetical protein
MRSRRSFATPLAVALAIGLIGAPVASGDPQADVRARPTIVHVNDRSGFDWADAGVGAAGGFALSVLGAGLVLLVSEHRAHISTIREGKQ